MKKNLLLLALLVLFTNLYAQSTPLIDAAKARDFKTFQKLVNSGVSLEETTEAGLNLQLALAYFNDKDFSKACALLDKKGFDFDKPAKYNISLVYILSYSCSYEKLKSLLKYNVDVNKRNELVDLKPIDATQFSTFKFYSEQIIPKDAYIKAEKVRDLLMENGSEHFVYFPLTFKTIGNFFFCNVNVIASIYPFIDPSMLNSNELFDMTEAQGQPQATIIKEKLIDLYNALNLDVEINSYSSSKEILNQLSATSISEDVYFLIACLGNNPLVPYQWVNIQGGDYVNISSKEIPLNISNPDETYNFMDFQVKDISQLITIKVEF